MPSQLPLDMLINLAKESTDEAARLLGRLTAERSNAQRQLSMLHDYRQDYLERLQTAMTTGMAASDCHNYQRFIGTLDDAIGQQQGVLRQAEENLSKGQLYWQQEKRKLNSYDALAQREQRAQALVESRREQRANDEYSARLVQRQASGMQH
ncbi:flagellar export protein FliJ [Achromobacter mucicolens]|jgi:flagellar protein FliJ|uniref:Flagellar FliJ protein n=1 Tax=Achromobacter mucicolens TaxID=1389922 RepID=A0ABD4YW97_9BURK|nr:MULTISPECIES: flagellar export protein FliJ [Achromobacter]KXJ64493.1 flagellar export protein FliJ [Achromobacter xylosoxidans]MDI6948741.1 flagellar export protein FliJ [Serratia sp. Se-RSmG]OXC91479.1 flagellar biosynthesis chaperone FliJ [Achromobacter sp. KAs 3-5]KRB17200.1 flagellar export protein FliJ [Achromobacter sp. Root170]MCP2513878.1 flagella biosynthesis chaperone FliJ [Achromobacter mucicolens]